MLCFFLLSGGLSPVETQKRHGTHVDFTDLEGGGDKPPYLLPEIASVVL